MIVLTLCAAVAAGLTLAALQAHSNQKRIPAPVPIKNERFVHNPNRSNNSRLPK